MAPRRVYEGSFGRHSSQVVFIPLHADLYISAQPKKRGASYFVVSRFAVVSRTGTVSTDAVYEFDYWWGDGDLDVTSYAISGAQLETGSLKFFVDPNDKKRLLYDHDRNLETPPKQFPTVLQSVSVPPTPAWFSSAARADTLAPAQTRFLLKALSSPNRQSRSYGLAALRRLSPDELRRLLTQPDLPPQARRAIEFEQARRSSAADRN